MLRYLVITKKYRPADAGKVYRVHDWGSDNQPKFNFKPERMSDTYHTVLEKNLNRVIADYNRPDRLNLSDDFSEQLLSGSDEF